MHVVADFDGLAIAAQGRGSGLHNRSLVLDGAFDLGFQFGWLNGVRMGLLALTFVPLVAAMQTAPALRWGRFERDRLGSNQQPSVS